MACPISTCNAHVRTWNSQHCVPTACTHVGVLVMISMHTNSIRLFLVVAIQLHSLSNCQIVANSGSNMLHVARILHCMIYPYAQPLYHLARTVRFYVIYHTSHLYVSNPSSLAFTLSSFGSLAGQHMGVVPDKGC